MNNEKAFIYNYSAERSKEVERIREKYLPNKKSKLDELRELDSKAQSAGHLVAIMLGIVGCLIFGTSMCMALGVFGGGLAAGIPLGVLGTLVMVTAYPVFAYRSSKAKRLLAPRIIELSEEITNKNNK